MDIEYSKYCMHLYFTYGFSRFNSPFSLIDIKHYRVVINTSSFYNRLLSHYTVSTHNIRDHVGDFVLSKSVLQCRLDFMFPIYTYRN